MSKEDLINTLYLSWCENLDGDCEEVKKAESELRLFDDKLRQVLDYESFFKYDDVIENMSIAYQRQAFTEGFQTAVKLITGGTIL